MSENTRSATPMSRQIAEHHSLLDRTLALPRPILVMLSVLLAGFAMSQIAIGYLVISGQLDGKWYDIRDLGNAMISLDGVIQNSEMDSRIASTLAYLIPTLAGATGIVSIVGGWLLIGPWVERRLIAKFQIRQGPNRTGPFGLLQTLADALKLMQKEIIIPSGADRFLYFVPPVAVFIPAILGWAPIPWSPKMSYADLDVGVLFVIAISSLGVLAVFMAGWASNNHYSLLGAMRTIAMMISYEIPISVSLLAVVLLTGSTKLSEIVLWQSEHGVWLVMLIPFAALAFLFASTAEINRTPNDIGEAESEIVAGFYTEYSGMKAGLFMGVELGNAILVGALMSTFFLGGYTMFGLETWIPGYLILATKIGLVYFLFVWIRATLPRFRLDQLMGFAWKFLIPVSIALMFLTAIESSILVRWDVPNFLSLGLIGLVNITSAAGLTFVWLRLLFRDTDLSTPPAPILTRKMGGLQAAKVLRG
jgi:NADH-quinone oxidoreductase subunit H